jgi:hypothetical protein
MALVGCVGCVGCVGYYIPHITLSKVPQDIDYDTINAGFVEFEVHAVKEYYETLNMEK